MEAFLNAITGRALTATSNMSFSSDVGSITSYDPVKHLVIVQIHPATDDEPALQTGWIPYSASWVGNGWGLYAAPVLNTLCSVLYQQGSRQIPIAAAPLFDGNNRPLTVESGEFWLVHATGSSLKLTNDGNLSLSSSGQINITAPTVNINASTECNIFSPVVKAGASGGAFEKLMKIDSSPTVNLQGS